MRKNPWMIKLVAGLMAFAIIGAACGSADDDSAGDATGRKTEAPAEEAPETEGATGVDTPAAGLVQTLTNGLAGHEYLAGIAVTEGVLIGLDSAEFKAAAEALDNNSVALADAIGSVYGDEARDQFLDLWRKHIGFFVSYTKGQATGDKRLANQAKNDLDGYRADFGAFIDAATNGELPKDAVEEALAGHVESTLTTIDAVAGKQKGNPFSLLREAANKLPGVATALAAGIASSQGIEGQVDSPASNLQQTLTSGLAGHEYLAGIAVAMGVQQGLDSDLFMLAAEALDENSVELADAIGSVYGDEGRDQFLDLWRKHIGFFVSYTEGVATGNNKQAKQARKDLDGYRSDFGAFIEAATEGGLPKAAVEDALKVHVKSTLDTIDTVLGESDGNPFEKLRMAENHLPGIATALATAIAAQQGL